jgi:hypothetical protein
MKCDHVAPIISCYPPEFLSAWGGTNVQIDAGLTGQVLSVSEGLLTKLSAVSLVSPDKGLTSAIRLFPRLSAVSLVRSDKGLTSVIWLKARVRDFRLVSPDKAVFLGQLDTTNESSIEA